jgi:hypothetical protein
LGIYPKDCDTGYSRGTCTSMFIAALFTIAKLRVLIFIGYLLLEISICSIVYFQIKAVATLINPLSVDEH